jgi:dTDP-4-amino-4,6-dideoxy-D-galactose acyltransferase
VSLVEQLQWDSALFGFSIGQVSSAVTAGEIQLAVDEAEDLGVQCLYLLVAGDDEVLLASAQTHGFEVRDVRLEMERSVAGHPAETGRLRTAGIDDLSQLVPIARERFRETRFFADKRFPTERSSKLYVEWLRRGLTSRPQRQTLMSQDPSGFVVCHLDPASRTGSIELIGVAKEATGLGLGRTLMAGAGALFIETSMDRATVVTQGRNIRAQRLYQACGYRTTMMSLWLHRWSPSASDKHPSVPDRAL